MDIFYLADVVGVSACGSMCFGLSHFTYLLSTRMYVYTFVCIFLWLYNMYICMQFLYVYVCLQIILQQPSSLVRCLYAAQRFIFITCNLPFTPQPFQYITTTWPVSVPTYTLIHTYIFVFIQRRMHCMRGMCEFPHSTQFIIATAFKILFFSFLILLAFFCLRRTFYDLCVYQFDFQLQLLPFAFARSSVADNDFLAPGSVLQPPPAPAHECCRCCAFSFTHSLALCALSRLDWTWRGCLNYWWAD